MSNTKAFLFNKGELVQFVRDRLTGLMLTSPLTMTIVPGKSAGYFVYIATDTELEGIAEIMQEFSSQFLITSPETHTQVG